LRDEDMAAQAAVNRKFINVNYSCQHGKLWTNWASAVCARLKIIYGTLWVKNVVELGSSVDWIKTSKRTRHGPYWIPDLVVNEFVGRHPNRRITLH